MNQDFWLERWENKQIGFHQADGHPMLHKHWPQLSLPADSRVLVPLCGKSPDMRWLADQGHHVTGIEFSAIAAQEFFAEASLAYRHEHVGDFDCYIGEQIEIRVGDVFDLPAADLARFEAFYDRAALIALPDDMRRAYVRHLMGGLRRGATGLLITFGYDASLMDGPPFNVDDEDVGELYGPYAHVDLLAERRGLPESDHLRDRGLSETRDGIYRIVRR